MNTQEILPGDPKGSNLPSNIDPYSLCYNCYYWIRTERSPDWFPAKRFSGKWYVAGVKEPLNVPVLEVDGKIEHKGDSQ